MGHPLVYEALPDVVFGLVFGSCLSKRWAATVGRPEIQKFAGALHGQHATKGIFITTSDFSRDANDYVSKIGSKIVLIDGSRLAELMIEFEVAVATDAIYTVKRIDNDFFESI
jgi:restriction system protein